MSKSISILMGYFLVVILSALGGLFQGASAQLSRFEFSPIISPQIAGDSFLITVIAKDAQGNTYPYNDIASLKTSHDEIETYTYVEPFILQFINGIVQRKVFVKIADTLSLICKAGNILGYSNRITVYPNDPEKFFVILPGEIFKPGWPTGKINPPQIQTAGRSFDISVFLVDDWFNKVSGRTDSVYFSASDSFVQISPGILNNGGAVFPVTFRTAGSQQLIAKPAQGSPILSYTSNSVDVVPGQFARILLLFPGETVLSGDTTTEVHKTPGKTGRRFTQYVKEPFLVKILTTDSCWNRTLVAAEEVELESDFAFSSDPETGELENSDSVLFSVSFDSTGENQNLWASTSLGLETYRSFVDIEAKTKRIETVERDTIRAGEIEEIVATLYDANDQPIKGKFTKFSVIRGNGIMLDSSGITDTLGVVRARFQCEKAFASETDTIKISADDFNKLITIFIEADSTVMTGKVIAFPNPFGYNSNFTEIQYYVRRSSDVTFAIYDPFGNPVLLRKYRRGEEGGKLGVNKVTWDGKDNKGRKVANGVYLLRVSGILHTGTIFNYSYRIGVIW